MATDTLDCDCHDKGDKQKQANRPGDTLLIFVKSWALGSSDDVFGAGKEEIHRCTPDSVTARARHASPFAVLL